MRSTSLAFLVAAIVLFAASPAVPLIVDCVPYNQPTLREGTLLGATAPGAVAIGGNLACLVNDGELWVVHADPDTPVVQGIWTPPPGGEIAAVAMGLDFAVVLIGNDRLVHLDLRNPVVPVQVGSDFVAAGPVGRISVAGDRVCAQVGNGGLLVLEQRDGEELAFRGMAALTGTIRGISMLPTHAYVVCGNELVTTVDITDVPFVVGTTACDLGLDVEVVGTDLVVDSWHTVYDHHVLPISRWRYLDFYSLDVPEAPEYRGNLYLPPGAHFYEDVPLQYLAGTSTALLSWDAYSGDMLAIEVAAQRTTGALSRPGAVTDAAAFGDVAVAATADGFRFYDATCGINAGPQHLFFARNVHPWRYAAGGHWLVSGRAYSDYTDQLIYMQLKATNLITDAERYLLDAVNIWEWATPLPVAVSENLVVFEAYGLRVADVAVGSFSNSSILMEEYFPPYVAAIAGRRVLVATSEQLTLWDCQEPTAAVVVDQWPLSMLPREMIIPDGDWGEGTVVLAYDNGSLEVRELTSHGLPAVYQLPQPANALVMDGIYAIFGTELGLLRIELFGPAFPGQIVELATTEKPVVDLEIESRDLYVSLGAYGQRVYRLMADNALLLAAGGPASTRLDLATAADATLTVVASRAGLAGTIGVQCHSTAVGDEAPAALRIAGAAPNPFNPRTTIHFTVDRAQPTTLALFDARGRLVRILREGPTAAGTHAAAWDGCDRAGRPCATGVYIARLRGETAASTTKLMLMR